MKTTILAALAAALASAQAAERPQRPALDPTIRADELSAHVHFLASDELRGRDTGSPELNAAARYLADVLRRSGLEPAGDDGGWLQAVPLVRSVREAAPELEVSAADGSAAACAYGLDFTMVGGEGRAAGLRVLTVAAGEDVPERADPELALFLATRSSDARNWLEAAGFPLGRGFGAIVYRGTARPREREPVIGRERPRPAPREGAAPEPPQVRVNGALLERFDAGEVRALSVATHVRTERVETCNVVGRIAGAGTAERPELAGEAVVFSAHYDHLGLRVAPQDASEEELSALDLVFNGADDDASGTACVLELAHAFAAGPRSARTLIFLLVTGEERGLLGTRHYLSRPVVPLERTVCNLNYEMIGRPDEESGGAGRMWLTGHERSNLFEAVLAAGIPISPDTRPEQRFFQRSDNYAFALAGVVAQTFSTYNMHGDYHTVRDEADALDYAHMEACVQAAYQVARLVSDGRLDPAWLEGMAPAGR